MSDAATGRERALAAARDGDVAGAAHLFADVTSRHPRDAPLLNSAGSFHAGIGQPAEALTYFDRALAADGTHGEAAINRAVVLTRLGRAREAAAALTAKENQLADMPRYWTTRAAAEIDARQHAAAAASYARALARDRGNARALAGAARVALETGATDAVVRHQTALARTPGDACLLLGLADALDATGRHAEAVETTAALARQVPGWLPGMERHADLLWAQGEATDFCQHYRRASTARPDAALFRSWASRLAGVDRHGEAADVIADARRRWPDNTDLALDEAVYRDTTGDHASARAIFDAHPATTPDQQVHQARHRLRTGDPAAAEGLLDHATRQAPAHVAAWSLRDLCWRLLGDSRSDWLSGQAGLVQQLELDLAPMELAAAIATLDRLHEHASTPIGQSVKRGSQTRGALFARNDGVVTRIHRAVCDAIERYRTALPAIDETHPLLRHRDAAWSVTGSWSIRLTGSGHHASHIHPHGIISSAAYFVVPDPRGGSDRDGWLELGRPPADLHIDLPPISTIQPRVGHCVLFPSTLYHGTRPINAGKRMTVAFDVGSLGGGLMPQG